MLLWWCLTDGVTFWSFLLYVLCIKMSCSWFSLHVHLLSSKRLNRPSEDMMSSCGRHQRNKTVLHLKVSIAKGTFLVIALISSLFLPKYRFIQHPKNFGLIASFLERKVPALHVVCRSVTAEAAQHPGPQLMDGWMVRMFVLLFHVIILGYSK